MQSLWEKQEEHLGQAEKNTDAVLKNRHWDVIVVGAGMAGILIAWYLKEQGKRVLAVEAKEVGAGQTAHTTAKITSQHGLKYKKLIEKIGLQQAKLYAQANEAAIEEYEKLIEKLQIECQFERVPAYLYSRQEEMQLLEEVRAAASLGIDAVFTKDTELPFEVQGAACFPKQAQFSPLKFIRHIAGQLDVLEHTRVIKIRGNKVMTADGMLSADQIVVAAHYPIRNVPGFYFLRQHQERSYVLALSGCREIEGMYYGIDPDGFSFRQAGEYLLLGGSGRRTGACQNGGAYEKLMQAAQHYFPDSNVELMWAAQDCMPHDGIPFIGNYSIFTPNLYVATGFQKWGMTTSMIAAMILRDLLCGEKNPYAKLFSPQRLHIRAGMPDFLFDAGVSIKGLARGLFAHPRCPHMGCELVWNPEEKSWDCPCHGSRFGQDGTLLDHPAGNGIRNQ